MPEPYFYSHIHTYVHTYIRHTYLHHTYPHHTYILTYTIHTYIIPTYTLVIPRCTLSNDLHRLCVHALVVEKTGLDSTVVCLNHWGSLLLGLSSSGDLLISFVCMYLHDVPCDILVVSLRYNLLSIYFTGSPCELACFLM